MRWSGPTRGSRSEGFPGLVGHRATARPEFSGGAVGADQGVGGGGEFGPVGVGVEEPCADELTVACP